MTFTREDEHWMRQALTAANLATEQGEVPVGAVLVHDGKLLAAAHNAPIKTNDPTSHAEVLVLRHAAQSVKNYRLVNTTLYVTLEPCIMCVGAMLHARVQRLVIGTLDQHKGVVQSKLQLLNERFLNHKIKVESGLLAEECKMLLKNFFNQRRQA